MNKSIIITVIGLFLLIAACGQTAEESTTQAVSDQLIDDTASQPDKVFVLTGENFKFIMDGTEAPELKVNKGDIVRIEFTSTSGFHDWKVDEFNAATKRVNSGESSSVEFVADTEGTFEYYCSVGSHRALGMKGMLVVE